MHLHRTTPRHNTYVIHNTFSSIFLVLILIIILILLLPALHARRCIQPRLARVPPAGHWLTPSSPLCPGLLRD